MYCPSFSICQEIWMNIRKWKDSPALKETRDMLETKLEDKKVRGILNWIFQIKYPHLKGETSLYIKPVEVMMRLCISAA